MHRKIITNTNIFRVICVVLVLILCIFLFALHQEKSMGAKIIHETRSFLSSYPQLPLPYTYSELIIYDGSNKYLALHMNGKVLTAKESSDGMVTYGINGVVYTYSENNALSKTDCTDDPIQEILRLLQDRSTGMDASFTTKRVSSSPHPLWISWGETYIDCTPEGYDGYIERMTLGNSESCLRWYILSPEGDVHLFVHACNDDHRNWYKSLWGDLADSVWELF